MEMMNTIEIMAFYTFQGVTYLEENLEEWFATQDIQFNKTYNYTIDNRPYGKERIAIYSLDDENYLIYQLGWDTAE